MLAAENGHTEVVLALIANKAGVNAKNLVRLRYYVSTGEGARECIEEWNGDVLFVSNVVDHLLSR
jgi:hypothetical protein